jgi:hypothetical protein
MILLFLCNDTVILSMQVNISDWLFLMFQSFEVDRDVILTFTV